MKMVDCTRYNSRWDKWTWLILGLVAGCCIIPCFMDDGFWPVVVCVVMLLFVLLAFIGIFYKIEGNKLVVYSFFIPTAYPVEKIKEVRKTNLVLSAPATSLTHRLEVVFSEPMSGKNLTPLIISPVRQEMFISQLRSINPNIIVS